MSHLYLLLLQKTSMLELHALREYHHLNDEPGVLPFLLFFSIAIAHVPSLLPQSDGLHLLLILIFPLLGMKKDHACSATAILVFS